MNNEVQAIGITIKETRLMRDKDNGGLKMVLILQSEVNDSENYILAMSVENFRKMTADGLDQIKRRIDSVEHNGSANENFEVGR